MGVSALVSCVKTDKELGYSNGLGRAFIGPSLTSSKKLRPMKRVKRQLVLNKGAEKFIFRYESGCEEQLLDALIEQAKDNRTDFDWFDAAVLSFRLTQSLVGQADELLRENMKA